MGAFIEFDNINILNGEKRGDLIVRSSKLINVDIPAEIIPNIIDEIPILAIAGIFAEGDFIIKNAKELRHKESDRIKSVCENLKLVNLDINEFDDGFSVSGILSGTNVTFESYDDHRIAMAFSVLSLLMVQGSSVKNFECVNISNPYFLKQLEGVSI
jgi:3-phosphoshikimate 1-carboxyvinyltransferase